MAIDYVRFLRVLNRSTEVALDPKSPPILGLVYKAKSEEPIVAYLAADKAIAAAQSAYAKEQREGLEALSLLDGPYRQARSSVAAILPDRQLPDTLKSLPTDTDKVVAIEGLLDLIDDHVGTPWADALLAGPFGQQAPKVVKEVNEAVAANKDLGKAILARATAYGPAYEAYKAFKRLVRDTFGPGSKEYRRIHLRASPGKIAEEDIDDTEPAAPSNTATPAIPATPATPTPVDPGQPPA